MLKQPTNLELQSGINDIISTIHEFASHTERHFQTIEAGITLIKSDVGMLKTDVGTLKSESLAARSDINRIKMQMVTKDYLDDKLADMRSDLILLIQKTKLKH